MNISLPWGPTTVLKRNPDFRCFWIGNFVSSSGVWVQSLAQAWLLLKLTNSPLLLGLAGFFAFAPTLVLSVIGGTVADHADRQKILFASNVALMLLAIALGLATSLGVVTPSHVLTVILLSGIAGALVAPAYQAVIPDLVSAQDLGRAIALNSIQFNVARILGHSIAGVLIASVGEAACFYINALTYLAILDALRRIRPRLGARVVDRTPFAERFKAGFSYVRERETAGYAIAIVALISFFGLPYFFLLPAIGRDVLGQGPEGIGYLMGSVSVGALAAALVVTNVTEHLGRNRTAGVASLAFWVCLIGFSLCRSYWFSVVYLIGLGFALVLTVVAINGLLQVLAVPAMRGRVMGLYGTALNGFAPVGALLSGSLAQATSTTAAIGVMAAAGLTLTALVVLRLLWASNPEVQYA